MQNFYEFAVPGVISLRPYQPGKPEEELAREYGVRDIVKLASNENPLGASPRAVGAMAGLLKSIARYPDDNGFTLKGKLGARHRVDTKQITLGTGSCNVLELVLRTFAGSGSEVVFSQYAFAMYPILTQLAGATPVVVPARDFGHDPEAMAAAVTRKTRVMFIANPNNPTGTWLTTAQLRGLLETIGSHVVVVVDEAYFEYASFPAMGVDDYPDASQWLSDFPNLVVTRTFSKAYALAGLRIGYALSHPEVADLINRVRQPFNVNNLGMVAAAAAMDDSEHLEQGLALNVAGLQQLYQGLRAMGFSPIPSAANFVCFDVERRAKDVFEALLHEGVIVRPVSELPHHLRVSVGTAAENERFLYALAKVLID